MVTYLIIASAIIGIGILSYYTSAWFGVKASNTGKIPPYYENLLRQLQHKKKARNEEVSEENESVYK
ncbi:hypothetical protein [Spirosoma sp. KNUC1025]|uniref:hypothetical protein n=1 Tax=Spirosoma sp. KNUC1025 TaxID=2894082 RepID=UPI003866DA64|nr:hypothetical protein LN737_16070 [Spirosoma sp. KNUC1025]